MLKLAEIRESEEYQYQGRGDRQRHREMLESVKAEYGVEIVKAMREIQEIEDRIKFYEKHGSSFSAPGSEDNLTDIAILRNEQAEIARKAGIEVEEETKVEAKTERAIEVNVDERKPNPPPKAPKVKKKSFKEKVSDLDLTEEERDKVVGILKDSNANSLLVKMMRQDKRGQNIAIVFMGHEAEARTLLA